MLYAQTAPLIRLLWLFFYNRHIEVNRRKRSIIVQTQWLWFFSTRKVILFLPMVFTAISSLADRIRAVPESELFFVFLATLFVALSCYGGGLLLGRGQASKKALTVNMGQKNASLCIWLALSNFDPLTPAAVYIIIHHFLNSLLIFIFSRPKRKKR